MDLTGKSPAAVKKRKAPESVELKDPESMEYDEIRKLFKHGESLPRAYFLRLIQAGKKFDEYYRDFKIIRIMDVDHPSVVKRKEKEIAIASKCMEPETMSYDEIKEAFRNPRVLPRGEDLLQLFRAAKKFDQFYDDFPVKRPATDDDDDDDDDDADDTDDYDDTTDDDDDDEGYSTEDELKKLCPKLPPYDEFVDDDTDDVLCGTYNWEKLVARGKELREAEERAAKGNIISCSKEDDENDTDDTDDDEGYSTEDQLEKLCRNFTKYNDFVDRDTDGIIRGTYNWDNLAARAKELREDEERAAKGIISCSNEDDANDANLIITSSKDDDDDAN